MTEKETSFYSQVKQIGVLTAIPLLLLTGPAVGFFIGSWMDRKAHVYPWFTLIFLALGFAAAGKEISKILKEVLKGEDGKRPSPPSPPPK